MFVKKKKKKRKITFWFPYEAFFQTLKKAPFLCFWLISIFPVVASRSNIKSPPKEGQSLNKKAPKEYKKTASALIHDGLHFYKVTGKKSIIKNLTHVYKNLKSRTRQPCSLRRCSVEE